MNSKFRFTRIVVAASVGSLLWAGCASFETPVSRTAYPRGPVNLAERRPDTHPELRSGLWGFSQEDYRMAKAPGGVASTAGDRLDPTALAGSNRHVIETLAALDQLPGTEIREAAGAAPSGAKCNRACCRDRK